MKQIAFILGAANLFITSTQLLGQPVLTGVEVFAADSSGNATGAFVWSTLPGDAIPNAWLDSGPSILNGPTDSLAPVMSLVPESLDTAAGFIGDYYINVRNDYTVNPDYIGLSLWFNSSVTPQISVFGTTSAFGLPHSPRPGFSDTFTDGTWTVKIRGESFPVSLSWSYPDNGSFSDMVGPFSVGNNGILDAGLTVYMNVTAIPEPNTFLLSALGSFLLLSLRGVVPVKNRFYSR